LWASVQDIYIGLTYSVLDPWTDSFLTIIQLSLVILGHATTAGTIFPYKPWKVRGMAPLVNHESPSASKSHINCPQVLSSHTNQQKRLKGTLYKRNIIAFKISIWVSNHKICMWFQKKTLCKCGISRMCTTSLLLRSCFPVSSIRDSSMWNRLSHLQ